MARFVASRIPGCERGFEKHAALGVVTEEGGFIADVIFHDWNPEAGIIELSAAADDKRWLSRRVLRAMFSYPFDEIGCQMAMLRVSDRNEPMKRIAKAYGFEGVKVPRLYGRNQDGWLFMLTEEAWRFSRFHKRSRDGQVQ